MQEFKNELIDGIVEVSIKTGTPAKECIETAIEMIEIQKQARGKVAYRGKMGNR